MKAKTVTTQPPDRPDGFWQYKIVGFDESGGVVWEVYVNGESTRDMEIEAVKKNPRVHHWVMHDLRAKETT